MMVTKIRIHGNKLIATIPANLRRELNIEQGDFLDLDFKSVPNDADNKPMLKIIIKGVLKNHTS